MVRRSWLDGMIENFQHRWETNPQYRATMSGILGVVFLVFMCSCVGVVSAGANVALTSLGFGGGASGGVIDTNTGSRAVHSAGEIPIATVVLGPQQAIPETTLPSSGTPLPTATPSPTATATATPIPCTSNCGGGKGGGGGTISGTPIPTIWKAGTSVILHIHTSNPNTGYSLIFNLHGAATDLKQPAGVTDGTGNDDYTYNVPSYVTNGQGQITITGSDGSANTTYVQCTA